MREKILEVIEKNARIDIKDLAVMLGISEIEVARRDEIEIGDAKILLNLENGVRKEYDIKIEKIYKNNNTDNKSMLIKVIIMIVVIVSINLLGLFGAFIGIPLYLVISILLKELVKFKRSKKRPSLDKL